MKSTAMLLVLVALGCACSGAAGEQPPPKLSAHATQSWSLVSAYVRAHKEHNVEHALALVHLASVDSATRDVLIRNLNEDFQKELVSATLVPLQGDEQLEHRINGRRIVPTLPVDKRLMLVFRTRDASGKEEESRTEYYVGTLSGREMIASSKYVD
jgi:hypothetical protein